MKKALPYITGGAALLLLVLLLLANRTRRLDERITLLQKDKIPYGTAVAKHLLPTLFPQAQIYTDARYPGSWDDIDPAGSNQAVILMADYFNADVEELKHINRFISNGNTVYIIARALSDDAAGFFNLRSGSEAIFFQQDADSLQVKLNKPPFAIDTFFVYPGKKYDGLFYQTDKRNTALLGQGSGGVNFVQLNKGRGRFYLHASPLAFSNYFILHKQNVAYYQQALSVIPPNTTAVLWNEYFLQKRSKPSGKEGSNWLGALFKVPAFKAGFLTALLFLLLFVLLQMRRKQRVIQPHDRPKNDSLDFVKTLGRLYYDRGDHRNLAEKMGTYFLEHVRSTYKIATHTLDDDFSRILHLKSGYPEPEIKNIVMEIAQLKGRPNISEERLAHFHNQLELFYQNT